MQCLRLTGLVQRTSATAHTSPDASRSSLLLPGARRLIQEEGLLGTLHLLDELHAVVHPVLVEVLAGTPSGLPVRFGK
jgi:hypothetical protein